MFTILETKFVWLIHCFKWNIQFCTAAFCDFTMNRKTVSNIFSSFASFGIAQTRFLWSAFDKSEFQTRIFWKKWTRKRRIKANESEVTDQQPFQNLRKTNQNCRKWPHTFWLLSKPHSNDVDLRGTQRHWFVSLTWLLCPVLVPDMNRLYSPANTAHSLSVLTNFCNAKWDHHHLIKTQ